MRISRTGGEKILNSRGEYNRCELVRIVAKETVEVPYLGDSEAAREDEDEQKNEDRTKEVEWRQGSPGRKPGKRSYAIS